VRIEHEEVMMATTYEEILELFRETDRLLKEQSQETDRKFRETERLLKKQSEAMEALEKLFTVNGAS